VDRFGQLSGAGLPEVPSRYIIIQIFKHVFNTLRGPHENNQSVWNVKSRRLIRFRCVTKNMTMLINSYI
jgi:hypothetical protein